MNINKLQLRSQIQINEESALKCMEFGTEYMLKKAEYRLLNPLFGEMLKREQLDEGSVLMAQLNAFCFVKPDGEKLKNSKLANSSVVQRIEQKNNKNLSGSGFIDIADLIAQQHSPQNSYHNQTPPTQPPILQDNEPRDSDSSKASSSKRRKFQKVTPATKSQKLPPVRTLPAHEFNFKKKPISPVLQQKLLTESPIIIKPIDTDSDSSDSFDNFPLAETGTPEKGNEEKEEEERESDEEGRDDRRSYHSSILGEEQKAIGFQAVSEHESEEEVSYLSEGRKRRGKMMVEKEQGPQQKNGSGPQRIMHKHQPHNHNHTHNQPLIINPVPHSPQSNHSSPSYSHSPPHHSSPTSFPSPFLQPPPSPEQITTYLMKLQSFQVQQQILMKKLSKVWSQQSDCLKRIQKLKWEDLGLPKLNRCNLAGGYTYADVIQ